MGVYLYLLPFGVDRNGFRSGQVMDGGRMLPHGVGAVGRKPAVLHPASQSEAQVHTDMIIQCPMVGHHIRAQRAISVCYLARNGLSFINETTVLLYLFG